MNFRTMLLVSAHVAGLGVVALWAQNDPTFTVRRKNWDDRSTRGECTIRVMVDDEVDVELRGDQVRLRTVAGRPGRDDGTECTQGLPQDITNFEFKGIDGRGNVRLVQEPRANNRWTAVVNIKDSKGGEEGYTFRLRWESRNGFTGNSGGGWNNQGNRPWNRPNNPGNSGNSGGWWGNNSSNNSGNSGGWWGNNNSNNNGGWNGQNNSNFSLQQSGSGSFNYDGRSVRVTRAYIDARGNRDVRLRLTPDSGGDIEFRGTIVRTDRNYLELDLVDSNNGRVRGRARVTPNGSNGIDSMQLDGDVNGRNFRSDFRR